MPDSLSFMRIAINEALKALGTTHPNPPVGAVYVKNNIVIAQGHTGLLGSPHAERNALINAIDSIQDSDLYVTLEPCCHHGKNPPCLDIIMQNNIRNIYIADQDPDPRVNGSSIAYLKANGVNVISPVLDNEALFCNRGFFSRIHRSRPFIIAKIATSSDLSVSPLPPQRINLTGSECRDYTLNLRDQNDAVMTGVNTILIDNPFLNSRRNSNVKIIIDPHAKLAESPQFYSFNIFQTRESMKVIIATKYPKKFNTYVDPYLTIVKFDNLSDLTLSLGKMGFNNILVEAGPSLLHSLLEQNVIDEIIHYIAPMTLGDNSLKVDISKFPNLAHESSLGKDRLLVYRK